MLIAAKSIFKYTLNKSYHQSCVRCTNIIGNLISNQDLTKKELNFGQATAKTHPHILKEGELLPGLEKKEFKSRRNKLMEKIFKQDYKAEMNPQVIIIPSASKVYMTEKIPYVFRQNSDFLYFSGCQEPDCVLILISSGLNYSTYLFLRPKDNHGELWDGPRTGIEGAIDLFEVDKALPITELEKFLVLFLRDRKTSTVWYDSANIIHLEFHSKIMQIMRNLDKNILSCPKKLIHQIRVIKSKSEINLMSKSCEIASDAISKTIAKSRPGINEQELYATVDYECRIRGAEFLAYPPVVAGGKNANIIHYISNNQIVNDKEMVLMDAGCEYHGYSSDITRTWPINGKFTPYQLILYEIVLDIQKILINKYKEMPTLESVYHEMCVLLGKRLQEEHIIPKHFSGNELISAAYSFCPHHVSHNLGMDVHDVGKISRSIKVEPGMIVTVEPGIYVNSKDTLAPKEFHNLGIRIEDDILIQDSGPIILSRNCPKEVIDIETLASQKQI